MLCMAPRSDPVECLLSMAEIAYPQIRVGPPAAIRRSCVPPWLLSQGRGGRLTSGTKHNAWCCSETTHAPLQLWDGRFFGQQHNRPTTTRRPPCNVHQNTAPAPGPLISLIRHNKRALAYAVPVSSSLAYYCGASSSCLKSCTDRLKREGGSLSICSH